MRFDFQNNAFFRALSKFCDIVILNALFIICSIPIITIGASSSALYTVMLKFVRDEEGYIFKGFFLAFKENFKKATIAWIIILLITMSLIVNISITIEMDIPWVRTAFLVAFSVIGLVLSFVWIYLFPLIARYENPLKATFINALLLSVGRLPYTALLLLIHIVPVGLTLFVNVEILLMGILAWLFFGFASVAWFSSKILRKVFEVIEDAEDIEVNEEDE